MQNNISSAQDEKITNIQKLIMEGVNKMFNELLKERLLDAHLEFFGKDKKKFLIHRILYAVVVTMLYTMIIMVIKNQYC